MRTPLLPLLTTTLGALLSFLWLPLLLPTCKGCWLAPLLTLAITSFSLPAALWTALSSGLFVDLLAGSGRLGIHALSFLLTLLLLRSSNKFPATSWSWLLVTFLFSALSTLMTAALQAFFGRPLLFSSSLLLQGALLGGLLDALATLLFLVVPLLVVRLFHHGRWAPYKMRRPR